MSVNRSTCYELLHPTTGEPVGGPGEAELAWSAIESACVQVTFSTTGSAVCWQLDRGMLVDAVGCRPVGLGDVWILPDLLDPTRLLLFLSSPNGRATIRLLTRDLAGFLHDTGAALPSSYDVTDLQAPPLSPGNDAGDDTGSDDATGGDGSGQDHAAGRDRDREIGGGR